MTIGSQLGNAHQVKIHTAKFLENQMYWIPSEDFVWGPLEVKLSYIFHLKY